MSMKRNLYRFAAMAAMMASGSTPHASDPVSADDVLDKAKRDYKSRTPVKRGNVGMKPKRKKMSHIKTEYFKDYYVVNGVRREYSDKIKERQIKNRR